MHQDGQQVVQHSGESASKKSKNSKASANRQDKVLENMQVEILRSRNAEQRAFVQAEMEISDVANDQCYGVCLKSSRKREQEEN